MTKYNKFIQSTNKVQIFKKKVCITVQPNAGIKRMSSLICHNYARGCNVSAVVPDDEES